MVTSPETSFSSSKSISSVFSRLENFRKDFAEDGLTETLSLTYLSKGSSGFGSLNYQSSPIVFENDSGRSSSNFGQQSSELQIVSIETWVLVLGRLERPLSYITEKVFTPISSYLNFGFIYTTPSLALQVTNYGLPRICIVAVFIGHKLPDIFSSTLINSMGTWISSFSPSSSRT